MTSVFSLLDERIRSLLKEKGIKEPTEIQRKAIPVILDGKHVLLIAPTGLGKTEAALLPVFNEFLKTESKGEGVSIVYITPLRALNRDMLRRTMEWGRKLGVSVSVRHGDTSQSERARQVRKPPDMLITTPETFQILFVGKRLRGHLKTVRWVVVDEIHELAGEERGAQLAVGLERLEELTGEDGHSFQRIGLSATVGSPSEVARFLGGVNEDGSFRRVVVVETDVSKRMKLDVEFVRGEKRDVDEAFGLSVEPGVFASLRRCRELIEEHKATLLFVNTRDSAEVLGSRFHLWDKGFAVDVHHGSLSKYSRVEAEEKFRSGELKGLICTSSLELGIDVGLADFVIQYTSPRQVTRLVQRVGRSGHMVGKVSRGKVIALSAEDFLESVVVARRALNGELEELRVRKNPYVVLAHQVISLAVEYKRIDVKRVYRMVKRAYPFSDLSWEGFLSVVDQLKDERRINVYGGSVVGRVKSRLYFIDNISMIPDEKSYAVVDITSGRRVGVLDESFVVNNGYEGASFILQGRPWRVVRVEEDSVLVTPVKEIGVIPSWVGEDIPVPFEVAQEVGWLRKVLMKGKKEVEGYPCNKQDFKRVVEELGNVEGFVVPSDDVVTVESKGNVLV
ncbi:MAG TPA: DEAD/DEAH box helicase, partial [Thermoplasmatales archaeon]|nr:DEAD/DEAH box helicase [Thermoplasmatales archaeon]